MCFIQLVSFNACTFISYSNISPFIFNVMLFMERHYSTLHRTSNRDNYRAVMFLCAWWSISFAITKNSIIQNLFEKLNIFRTERISSEIWDCQWHKTFCLIPVLCQWHKTFCPSLFCYFFDPCFFGNAFVETYIYRSSLTARLLDF